MDIDTKPNWITDHPLTARLSHAFLLWENPISATILATVIFFGFGMLGSIPAWGVSEAPYFNFLADAFLHGQLHLRLIPANPLDLSLFQGKYYLYWGPLPALLMLPLVAVFGTGASDILVAIVFGGIIAGLVAALLRQLDRRGWARLSAPRRALLVVFFTLGTAMTPLPAISQVWYLHTLEALAFALLAYVTAFAFEDKQAFFWTGVAVAAVLATRLSVVFIAIFPAWYLLRTHWHLGWRKLAVNCLVGLLPVAATLALLGLYNAARFGNPLENGVAYHHMGEFFRPLFTQYGLFNLHYVPGNFYYNYIDHPLVDFLVYRSGHIWGGSLFLMSPLFFAALYALWRERKNADTWVLLAAVLLGNLPVLMVMGPGSIHYGPRYALDFIVPLLMLTMLGMQRWPLKWVALLVGLSVLQYIPGAVLIGVLG